ncbi:MAG: hypothetical protein BroJett042_02400 [Bacteroidota bacterium]|nr:MAG: hypothetical protein BroJett042_02400 [Bacteroidota bacterium]
MSKKSKAPVEDPSKNFDLHEEGDQVKITWRNSSFYIISGLIVVFNILFVVNRDRLPNWFIPDLIIVSVVLIGLLWFVTNHQLIITPNYIKCRGGFSTLFGTTIYNTDIKIIYYEYKMSDDADAESEYVLYLVLANQQRVRISNRLSKAEAIWLQQQAGKYNPYKTVSQYNFPSSSLQFFRQHEFVICLFFSIILGTLPWLGHTEDSDIEVTQPTMMVLGWIIYTAAVAICWYRTRFAEIPCSLTKKIVFTVIATLLYGMVFQWNFNVL